MPYVTDISFIVTGGEGQRVVLFIDDLEVEGEVPIEDEQYQEEIQSRWRPCQQKLDQQISSWEEALKEMEKKATALAADGSPAAEKIGRKLKLALRPHRLPPGRYDAYRNPPLKLASIDEVRQKMKAIKNRGLIYLAEKRDLSLSIPYIGQLVDAATQQVSVANGERRDDAGSQGVSVYVLPHPTGSFKILSDSFIPGYLSDDLSIAASPGEYEPASFVVHALSEIDSLELTATELKGANGSLPPSSIDIKVVKCWYQGATAWLHFENHYDPELPKHDQRVLVPELLLNDDSLIRVDYEKQENYLKVREWATDAEKYVWISKEEEFFPDFTGLSIKDSPTLLPLNIPAGTNQQFWVTVRVPEAASPGTYTGTIEMKAAGTELRELRLKRESSPHQPLRALHDFQYLL